MPLHDAITQYHTQGLRGLEQLIYQDHSNSVVLSLIYNKHTSNIMEKNFKGNMVKLSTYQNWNTGGYIDCETTYQEAGIHDCIHQMNIV